MASPPAPAATATATATAFPGFSAPGAGFEVPLEMLAACHGRVQAQCDTLLRLHRHIQHHGCDRAAQQAGLAVMRYFDTAARHHHEDEEQDLFPALIDALAGSDARCVQALVDSLGEDHRSLERRWAVLRQGLERVAAGEPPQWPPDEPQGFVQHYQAHIAREEAELLPLAARLLDDASLDRVGRSMRGRRGVVDG